MILQIMVYAIAMAVALSVVGLCLERLAALWKFPRRAAWITALVFSILWPASMILRAEAHADAAPGRIHWTSPPHIDAGTPALSSIASATTTSAPAARPVSPHRHWNAWQLATDRNLLTAWAIVSLLAALRLIVAGLRLRRRIAGWHERVLHHQPVLISETTGPALVGVFLPRIVIPRWLLDEPPATQFLVLEHERQHIAALDPLLIRAGAVLLAIFPWNLPLWWQVRRMRRAIELDCDVRVLDTGVAARTYGEALLAVVERATHMPSGVLAMSEPVSALEQRIQNLLPDPVTHVVLRTRIVMVVLALSIGAACAMNAPAIPGRAASPVAPAAAPTAGSTAGLNMVLRAAVQKYPQLIRPDGLSGAYNLHIAVRADGTIYVSQLSFIPTPTGGAYRNIGRELYLRLSAWDGVTWLTKGQPVADMGEAAEDIVVSWVVLPADFDESRSAGRVADAVRAKHTDLMLPTANALATANVPESAGAYADVNMLTLFMSEDGQIAREAVEMKPIREWRAMNPQPQDMGSILAGAFVPPSVPAEAFKVLGLDPGQIGQTGLVVVAPERRKASSAALVLSEAREQLKQSSAEGLRVQLAQLRERLQTMKEQAQQRLVIVRYAWPRRPGEPVGGTTAPTGTIR